MVANTNVFLQARTEWTWALLLAFCSDSMMDFFPQVAWLFAERLLRGELASPEICTPGVLRRAQHPEDNIQGMLFKEHGIQSMFTLLFNVDPMTSDGNSSSHFFNSKLEIDRSTVASFC